jgi:hypothetical protein
LSQLDIRILTNQIGELRASEPDEWLLSDRAIAEMVQAEAVLMHMDTQDTTEADAYYNAIAAIAKNKREAAQLIREIQARIAAIPDDTTDWGHAGDAAQMVANLRIAAGHED